MARLATPDSPYTALCCPGVVITKDTPNPQGGEIRKDPKTGEPTGDPDPQLHRAPTKAEQEIAQNAMEMLQNLGLLPDGVRVH